MESYKFDRVDRMLLAFVLFGVVIILLGTVNVTAVFGIGPTPLNNSNQSTRALTNFSMSFINATDVIENATNVTFFYMSNLTVGTWVPITNETENSCTTPAGAVIVECSYLVNVSSLVDGTYVINATVSMSNGTTLGANFSENLATNIVFDSTPPDVQTANYTAPNGANVTGMQNYLINISFVDATIGIESDANRWLDSMIYFNISNASGAPDMTINASNATNSVEVWNATLNTTKFTEGIYNITLFVNDTLGNLNNSAYRTIYIDRTAPTVALAKANSTKTSVDVKITLTDSISGMNSKCTVDRNGATVSGAGLAQSFHEENLGCSSSYEYKVTCTDRANNAKTTAKTSFSTDACGGGSVGGGGGGSSGTNYVSTHVVSDEQFENGYTKELAPSNRVKVKVGNNNHHVGVTAVTATTATIEVASNHPVEATLGIGEEAKFEVSGDNFYDILVKLNGIVNGKADVTVQKIEEEIPAGADTAVVVDKEGEARPADTGAAGKSGGLGTGAWIAIIVVIVIIIAVVVAKGKSAGGKKKK
jgi:hypothetical protein